MSIGSEYWEEEVARRKDCFFYNEEQQKAIRNAGYFTRRDLNKLGAKPFRNGFSENWFVLNDSVYGKTACVFPDGIERFKKLLSGKLLLELA